ncbi:hypothetical protein FRC20_000385, partial [Serendipita sp. 405]
MAEAYDHCSSASRRRFERARMYEQQFDQEGRIDGLNNAIITYETGRGSLSRLVSERTFHHYQLGRLYERRFDWGNQIRDLDEAITNYEAGRTRFRHRFRWLTVDPFIKLASLYERRFVREDRVSDLDSAITTLKAGMRNLSVSDSQRLGYLSKLAYLHEQRFDWDGRSLHIHHAIENHEAALKLLSDDDPNRPSHLSELVRMRSRLKQVAKELLLEDLQQLSTYIRKPNSSIGFLGLMEGVIKILEENDADRLCSDIRDHSLRLGTYCEALRSQVGRNSDSSDLLDLYDEIVTTEREISAAHKNIAAKYERMYKLWREKREQISNMLLLLDSINSPSDTEAVRIRIQKVNEGFEQIRKALDDQGRTLKEYFDACKALIASTNSKGDPPSGPVPPDNPSSATRVAGTLPDPSDLPKEIEAGKERLSEIGDMIGKARYNNGRKVVEDGLSMTTTKLEKLHLTSQIYESTVLGLSLSTPHKTNWWKLWSEPSYLLPNLVKKMTNKLTEIQRGFDA